MRMERISDVQVRFVLGKQDLDERDIKMNELSYGSDKTRQLFQEIMMLAQDEYESEGENYPLMLEAMRVGAEAIIVVVTRISDSQETERTLNLIPEARRAARFKRKPPVEPPEESRDEDSISIFSFDTLDILASAVARFRDNFVGASQVFKYQSRYFLTLQNETPDDRSTDELEAVLFEYGEKHVSSALGRQYLVEHGETIIGDDAVEKLGLYID